MIPHTLMLAPQLRIRRIWNGYYYWGRLSVPELLGELREVTREIRADWDLASPGLKRWDSGDKRPLPACRGSAALRYSEPQAHRGTAPRGH